MPLIITTHEINNVIIFDIEGEFRRYEFKESSLPELVKAQLDHGKSKFLVNLEKLEFIDSFGVGEILASYIQVGNRKGVFKLAPFPGKLFKFNLIDFHPPREFLYSSVEDALADFSPANNVSKKWWQFW